MKCNLGGKLDPTLLLKFSSGCLLGGGGLMITVPVMLYRKFCRGKILPGAEENEDVPEEMDTYGKTVSRYVGVLCTALAFLTARVTDDFKDSKAVDRALEGHAVLYGACSLLSFTCLKAEKKICPRSLNIADAATSAIFAGLCVAAANGYGDISEPEPAPKDIADKK